MRFSRDPQDGRLTFIDKLEQNGDAPPYLWGPGAMASAGDLVVVATASAYGADTLIVYQRDSAGALTPLAYLRDGALDSEGNPYHLEGPDKQVQLSADGRSLYLYVDGTQRGLGIGRQLIEHVYATAKAAGCAKVHWLTHETNATAISLYQQVAERSGFIQFRKGL